MKFCSVHRPDPTMDVQAFILKRDEVEKHEENNYVTMQMITLKKKIHEQCQLHIQERIDTALHAIASVEAAGEEDTKSSAGDKYETSREMMKQELERHQQLLGEARRMEQFLEQLSGQLSDGDAATTNEPTIKAGNLVQTDHGLFYLAVGIGKLTVEGQTAFVLSPASPVGQLLIGRKTGDTITFNSRTYQIQKTV